jgi:epoxyqueuosine reductase
MLVDIELESDVELENRCGQCQRCIEVCPTKAIVADKVIDSRKCIVRYLNRDDANLPVEIQTAIEETGFIWGCDICQDVCPHNKKRQDENPILYDLLNEIENMTEEDFNSIFHNSIFVKKGHQKILRQIKNAMQK